MKNTLGTFIFTVVLLLVALSGAAVGYSIIRGQYFFALPAAAVAVGLMLKAISIYNSSLRKVAFMFNAIENDDFTFRFADNSINTNQIIFNQALNRIKELVQQVRFEVRESEMFYELILSKLTAGVAIVTKGGNVVTRNRAALDLLRLGVFSHLRQTEVISKELPAILAQLTEGETTLVKFYDESAEVVLSVTAAMVSTRKGEFKALIITDISSEVDTTRMESFARMSRVLTHEIMNHLAPINSLSETLLSTDDDHIRRRGLDVIYSTSRELMKFVDNYRSLTRIPTPQKVLIRVDEIIENVASLFSVEVRTVGDSLTVYADRGQITQVLTNLIKNGLEAGGRVWINTGKSARSRTFIEVCNDGELISDEIRENIFVPFFTTKEGGSGVGLSISRQIMRLHNGTLTLTTQPHTAFRMELTEHN